MNEPAGPITFSLFALGVAALGPVFGPFALIVFGAGVGSLLALSAQPAGTRWEGIKFILVGTLVAVCITGPLVWACTTYLGIPGNIALVPVAFLLGVGRLQLVDLVKTVLDAVAAAAGTAISAVANRGRGGGK